MKPQTFKLFVASLIIGLVTIFSAAAVQAQQSLYFDVSFDFHIGKEKMAAGKYQLSRLGSGKYILRNTETRKSAVVVFDAAGAAQNRTETVTFNRYGETYFLRSIVARRGSAPQETAESSFERKVRREAGDQTERIAVNLTQN